MTPLEKIKNGIINNDWDMVKDGYQSMTGDLLETPTATTGKRKAKKAPQTVTATSEMKFLSSKEFPEETSGESIINNNFKKLARKYVKKETRGAPKLFHCDGPCQKNYPLSKFDGSRIDDGKVKRFCRSCQKLQGK